LNVSVAAAIILNDLTARLRNSSVEWQLTEEEKNEKRLDWTKKTIKNIDQIVERFHASTKR